MTADTVFLVANTVAGLSWLLLCVRPKSERVLRLLGVAVPVGLATLYLVLIAARFGRTEGDFMSLPGVAALFRDPWVLLAGWVHYLAFDLLVGISEARDASERGVASWLLVPCLLLTFMFGPVGWLAYQVVRWTKRPATH